MVQVAKGLADVVTLGQVHEGDNQQLQHPGDELKQHIIINKHRHYIRIDIILMFESKNQLAGPESDLFEHPLLLQVTPLLEGDQQKLKQLLKEFIKLSNNIKDLTRDYEVNL